MEKILNFDGLQKDYIRYRWFFTSSDKLVIGGKSAEQNDDLLKKLKKIKEELIVMHTSEPGSPFSAILSNIKEISEKDKKECAIFTACFSQAWKKKKKTALVDVFSSKDIYKMKNMKIGTWGVKKIIERISSTLQLYLTIQKDVLRAVPVSAVKKESILIISPGNLDKKEFILKADIISKKNLNKEQLISAIPSGGLKII